MTSPDEMARSYFSGRCCNVKFLCYEHARLAATFRLYEEARQSVVYHYKEPTLEQREAIIEAAKAQANQPLILLPIEPASARLERAEELLIRLVAVYCGEGDIHPVVFAADAFLREKE